MPCLMTELVGTFARFEYVCTHNTYWYDWMSVQFRDLFHSIFRLRNYFSSFWIHEYVKRGVYLNLFVDSYVGDLYQKL